MSDEIVIVNLRDSLQRKFTMTLLYLQLMKNMKQLATVALIGIKSLGTTGLYLGLAAAFLWLVHMVTAPIGGIVFFSAIFTVALAGFACAVVLFHMMARLSRCFK
jgi:hypothetical protein